MHEDSRYTSRDVAGLEIMKFKWSRYDGYEVSGKGDKRFSAFNALMPDGRSIEHHYQCDVKGYDPGGRNWRLGKGKPPLNPKTNLWERYLELWRIWSKSNMLLLEELHRLARSANCTLSDRFATTTVNQAHALAVLLTEMNRI